MSDAYAVLGAVVLFVLAVAASLVISLLLAEIERLRGLMFRDAGVVASLQTELADERESRLSLLDDLNALERENVFMHQANAKLTQELAADGPALFTVRGTGYVAIGNRN